MTKRQAIKMISFFAVIILLTGFFSLFLRDRTTTLSSFYSEPKGSVDTFIVGSSHVNSTYIPAVLWQEYGIAAHNVFSWSQPMWISYHYIKEALRTQKAKVVVLEMYGMLYGNSYIMPEEIDQTNYKNSFSIDPGANFYAMTQTVKNCGLDLRKPADFLNLIRYHSRWKNIDENYFTYNPHNDHSPDKGYGFVLGTSPCPEPDIAAMQAITASREPYEKSIEYLEKIVALAKKENFELVFTLSPYVYNESEVEIFNWIQEYAEAHNIPFLNYNLARGQDCGFSYATDLSDNGHTNFYGAEKITRDLGEFISQKYPKSQISESETLAHLTSDAEYMYRTFFVNGYFALQNIDEYLKAVTDDELLDVYIVSNGIAEPRFLPEKAREIFGKEGAGQSIWSARLQKGSPPILAFANAMNDALFATEYKDTTLSITGARLAYEERRGSLDLELNFAENNCYVIAFDKSLNKLLSVATTNNDGTISLREIVSSDFVK